MGGIFPHAKASKVPQRSSVTPALAALIKQLPGFYKKFQNVTKIMSQKKSRKYENRSKCIIRTNRKACLHER